MPKINKELLKGSSEIIIMAVLASKPLYGYEIAKHIATLSDHVLEMGEGTLYPILHRLEQYKLLDSYWQEINGRRRKYYSLTAAGQTKLQEKTAEWRTFTRALTAVIKL